MQSYHVALSSVCTYEYSGNIFASQKASLAARRVFPTSCTMRSVIISNVSFFQLHKREGEKEEENMAWNEMEHMRTCTISLSQCTPLHPQKEFISLCLTNTTKLREMLQLKPNPA